MAQQLSATQEPLVLDTAAMRMLLENSVQMYGGQKPFSRRFDVNQRDVSLALAEKRPVSAAIARVLGFERLVEPRRVRFRRRPGGR